MQRLVLQWDLKLASKSMQWWDGSTILKTGID
jgi:hypothetical protein